MKSDEFSILIPVHPSLYLTERGPYIEIDEIKINKRRTFTAYVDEILYFVEIYDTPNPKGAMESLIHFTDHPRPAKKINVTVDGLKGKQFLSDEGDYYSNIQYFRTKGRVYVVGVATRNKGIPASNPFISSLKFASVNSDSNSNGDLIFEDATPVISSTASPAGDSADTALGTKEVTRRAVILMRRSPYISGGADSNGTIILRAVLSSSGHVTNVKVFQGLNPRLDQSAVDSANQIKFIPAEKDGHPVSQYIQIEYIIST